MTEGTAKQEGARAGMAALKARLDAAIKPKEPEPEPTPQERRAARLAELRAMQQPGAHHLHEMAWLETLAQRDQIRAEVEAGAREVNELRAQHREASQALAAMRGARAGLRGVDADRLLDVAREESEAFAEAAAIQAVVDELARRLRIAEQEQRDRGAEQKRLYAEAQMRLAKAQRAAKIARGPR